jgi:hypothetical protein
MPKKGRKGEKEFGHSKLIKKIGPKSRGERM